MSDIVSNANFELKSNLPEVLEALENAKAQALEAIGLAAEGHAKDYVEPRVDTGRLRNSISHAVKEDEGKTFEYTDDNGKEYKDVVGGNASEDAVYIGTNVHYADSIPKFV